MKKVLINFAHPAKSRSNVNRTLRKAVQDLDGVTVNDLYSNYPDFMIDVEREQALCEAHDVIIFQHPFYWYSSPAIVKEWMDLVLEHGWAYGSKGNKLTGKLWMQAISSGGDNDSYTPDGFNELSIAELTAPFRITAKLCSMTWLPPFVISGVHRGLSEDQLRSYAEDYRRAITALRDDRLDVSECLKSDAMNTHLGAVIKELN